MTVERVVSIPSGVSVTMDGTVLHVKGPKGNLQRDMWYPGIEITIGSEDVRFTTESQKKAVTSMVGTLASHCSNMCTGVTKGYLYSMKVCTVTFQSRSKLLERPLR